MKFTFSPTHQQHAPEEIIVRSDVHFVSVHGDPNVRFPVYAGYTHERGEGEGFNLNLPMPLKSEDPVWLAAIDESMVSIGNRAPDALLVSLGFDPFKGDPSADLAVSTEGFRAAGERIGAYGGPVVLVQEGGYLVEKLSDNLDAFLDGFMRARAVSTRSAP